MPHDIPKRFSPCINANGDHIIQPTITADFHSQPCAVRRATIAKLFVYDTESNNNADAKAVPKGIAKKQPMAAGSAQAIVQKSARWVMATKRIHVRLFTGRDLM